MSIGSDTQNNISDTESDVSDDERQIGHFMSFYGEFLFASWIRCFIFLDDKNYRFLLGGRLYILLYSYILLCSISTTKKKN